MGKTTKTCLNSLPRNGKLRLFLIPHSKAGYSLIEILVVITIVSIVFGSGYIAFREFARRQALGSASRQIIGDLRLAQTQALSGKKPENANCATSLLQGYGFVVTGPGNYEVRAICGGGEVGVKSVVMPTGVTLSTPSPNPIVFKVLGQGTNLAANATLTITSSGLSSLVTVTQGGTIE